MAEKQFFTATQRRFTVLSNRRSSVMIIAAAALSAGLFFSGGAGTANSATWETDLRRPKNPDTYGNVLMDRVTRDSKEVKPVVFSHWTHRSKYTCKACHSDLGFNFKGRTTEIKQSDIVAGKFCGACHDGKTSFGVSECGKCHSYGITQTQGIADKLKDLPKDAFGNKVDWAKAVNDGKIKPAANFDGTGVLKPLDQDSIIPVNKFTPHPPDVKFPHKTHTQQLECASCHDSIFKQKNGGNPEMNMMKIISGQFCGVCHAKVSFPIDDCFRCHSQPALVIDEGKKDEKKDAAPVTPKKKK
jgi:c(7)-type cytochrome triheme protein